MVLTFIVNHYLMILQYCDNRIFMKQGPEVQSRCVMDCHIVQK